MPSTLTYTLSVVRSTSPPSHMPCQPAKKKNQNNKTKKHTTKTTCYGWFGVIHMTDNDKIITLPLPASPRTLLIAAPFHPLLDLH